MKLKLKRINPVKWGLVIGISYALLSLIIVIPVFFIGMIADTSGFGGGMGMFQGATMLLLPILYAVIGFIFGTIFALIFNMVLGWIDGLDMNFDTVGMEIERSEEILA